MKNFAEFLAENHEAVYAHALATTKYNENGDAVISRDDPWFYEDEWDEHYKELAACENTDEIDTPLASAGFLIAGD